MNAETMLSDNLSSKEIAQLVDIMNTIMAKFEQHDTSIALAMSIGVNVILRAFDRVTQEEEAKFVDACLEHLAGGLSFWAIDKRKKELEARQANAEFYPGTDTRH